MRVAELRIECRRLCKQCLDLSKIRGWILRALSFPHAHRVVIRSPRIVRMQFRKAPEALDDLVPLQRRTVVSLRQKEVATGIRRAQVSASQQRLHRLVVFAARIKRDSQANGHPRRFRIPLRTLPEHFDRRFQRPVQKQFARPIEQIALARLHVRRGFKFIRRADEVPFFLLDLAKEVMQFRRILRL